MDHRLSPADLAAATARTGLDEHDLLAWLSALNTDVDDETLTFVTAWRSAALPGNPPPGAQRFLGRDPQEPRTWLDAGFDLYAGPAKDRREEWISYGFSAADAMSWTAVGATPAEARL